MYLVVSRIYGWIMFELISVASEWGNERRGCCWFVGGQLKVHVCVLNVINSDWELRWMPSIYTGDILLGSFIIMLSLNITCPSESVSFWNARRVILWM